LTFVLVFAYNLSLFVFGNWGCLVKFVHCQKIENSPASFSLTYCIFSSFICLSYLSRRFSVKASLLRLSFSLEMATASLYLAIPRNTFLYGILNTIFAGLFLTWILKSCVTAIIHLVTYCSVYLCYLLNIVYRICSKDAFLITS